MIFKTRGEHFMNFEHMMSPVIQFTTTDWFLYYSICSQSLSCSKYKRVFFHFYICHCFQSADLSLKPVQWKNLIIESDFYVTIVLLRPCTLHSPHPRMTWTFYIGLTVHQRWRQIHIIYVFTFLDELTILQYHHP